MIVPYGSHHRHESHPGTPHPTSIANRGEFSMQQAAAAPSA